MSVLVVTVNGPFAYVSNYPYRGDLTLMAPMCPQHMAGIAAIEPNCQYVFGRTNCLNHDADLGGCEAHVYDMKINLSKTNPGCVPTNFLMCPWPDNGFDAREWRFWLRVPQPDILLPVNPSEARIIKPEPNDSETSTFAVGGRLIYRNWDGNSIPLWYCGAPVPDPSDPTKGIHFDLWKGTDEHAYLEIEHAGPLRDDPFHEDAVNCFASLMGALGLKWAMYVADSGDKSPKLLTTHLHDCKGAVAWLGES